MNGGSIELVFMGFTNQRSHHWGGGTTWYKPLLMVDDQVVPMVK